MISKNKKLITAISFIFSLFISVNSYAENSPNISINTPGYWKLGDSYHNPGIRVKYTNSDMNNFKMELYKDNNYVALITNEITVPQMYYKWVSCIFTMFLPTIPTSLAVDNNYRLKVTSLSNSSIYSFSDTFCIIDYDIIVDTPKENDFYFPLEKLDIKFQLSKASANIDILPNFNIKLVDNNNGTTYDLLNNINLNELNYSWEIPIDFIPSNNCQIYLCSSETDNTWLYGNPFSISVPSHLADSELIVNSPDNATSLLSKEKSIIQWSINSSFAPDQIPERIDIKLFNKDTSNVVTIAEAVRSDRLNQIWCVPEDSISGDNYYIVLYRHGEKKIVGCSSNFSVFNPSLQSDFPLKMLSPDEKTILLQEDEIDINWEINSDLSGEVPGALDIVLYDQNRKKDTIIAQGIDPTVLNYSWTIPSDIPSSTKYYIKLFAAGGDLLKGCSKEFYIFNTVRLWDLDKEKGNIYYMGNKVGIGTANPEYELSVDGDINFTGSLYNDGEQFMTYKDGNVGIGTENPAEKLSVNGTIRAKKVIVNTDWSDFVFKNDYRLRPLEEVEKHIKEKGYLPDIPSESEVSKEGISLGEIDSKLLQKIEELTLYLIELKKENKELKERIEKLEIK